MIMSDIKLSLKHCMETLDRELLIRSEKPRCRKGHKRFTFHVLLNEYRVYKNSEIIDSGQAVEELLEIYNEL